MRANKTDPVLPPHPSAASLAALVALGAAAALGFLFLWLELVLARSGGSAFCALDAATSCTAAWDSPFASQIDRLSGLPLAAWGLVWSISAFVMPLLALLRQAATGFGVCDAPARRGRGWGGGGDDARQRGAGSVLCRLPRR